MAFLKSSRLNLNLVLLAHHLGIFIKALCHPRWHTNGGRFRNVQHSSCKDCTDPLCYKSHSDCLGPIFTSRLQFCPGQQPREAPVSTWAWWQLNLSDPTQAGGLHSDPRGFFLPEPELITSCWPGGHGSLSQMAGPKVWRRQSCVYWVWYPCGDSRSIK